MAVEDNSNGEVSLNDHKEEQDDEYTYTATTDDHPPKQNRQYRDFKGGDRQQDSLYAAVLALLRPIFFPDPNKSSSILHRTKASFGENFPHLREASRATGSNVLRWARQGSPLRLLFVISVGTITLLTLSGILVFLLFLAAATTNAIIVSLFISLAAAGGFLAIFFACLAAVYVGALSVAVFVISSVTITAIIAVFIVTGWIGFFWILWVAMRSSVVVAKNSVSVTGSALSAYTSAWHARRNHDD